MPITLNKREKYSIYGAGALVCLFLLIQLVVFPIIDKRDRLRRTAQVKTRILKEMVALKSEYDLMKKTEAVSAKRLASQEKGFRLFSFLDRLAGEVEIKEHIAYMKPSASLQKSTGHKVTQVEMKLTAVTMEQLVSYVYRIETSQNMVNVGGISILKTANPSGFIDVVLNVEAIEI